MSQCVLCGKRPNKIAFSRHQKGSSGASEWPLRAQIHKKLQKPNLHKFQGRMYCTKCQRIVKGIWNAARAAQSPVQA